MVCRASVRRRGLQRGVRIVSRTRAGVGVGGRGAGEGVERRESGLTRDDRG
jgi:hypothetical protein